MTEVTIRHRIDSFKGSYEFLSNFYRHAFMVGGREYATVEHAYQAAKTDDVEQFAAIANAASPGEAKKLGRKCKLRPDWEAAKFGVMRDLLSLKFQPGTLMAERLLLTDPSELIEGNTWGDRIWGVCRDEGENWLGWLLMAQRAYLLALEAA